jgi:hypothetical protein
MLINTHTHRTQSIERDKTRKMRWYKLVETIKLLTTKLSKQTDDVALHGAPSDRPTD